MLQYPFVLFGGITMTKHSSSTPTALHKFWKSHYAWVIVIFLGNAFVSWAIKPSCVQQPGHQWLLGALQTNPNQPFLFGALEEPAHKYILITTSNVVISNNISTLKHITVKQRKLNTETCIAFIDYKKTFNQVNYKKINTNSAEQRILI
jgi:hypothetical protein